MPSIQTITPPENSLFTTSIGNWTGNVIWEPGPVNRVSKMAMMVRNSSSDPDSMQLSFPYVWARRKDGVFLFFNQSLKLPSSSLNIKWELTDGINSISGTFFANNAFLWLTRGGYFNPPVSWKKNLTTIKITCINIVGYPTQAVFKSFLLFDTIPESQHLPVVGIG